jgi:hypothetical protein
MKRFFTIPDCRTMTFSDGVDPQMMGGSGAVVIAREMYLIQYK